MFILQFNPKLKELFPRGSIIPSFRRSKNLKELLALSGFKTVNEDQTIHRNNGCLKCDRNRCDLCRNFVESKSFLSFQTGKKYTIHSRLSCDSKNLIYLVSCKKCRLQYVGSTTTDFRIRFRNHKSAMLTKKTTCEVAIHFTRIPHTLGDFPFQCIDQVQAPSGSEEIDRLLITKEAYWSAQLFSLAPHGLNKRKEFHSKNRILYNQFSILYYSLLINRSKALFLDFVSLLGVDWTQRPCQGISLWFILFKGPSRDFVPSLPSQAPNALFWDFGTAYSCGCILS